MSNANTNASHNRSRSHSRADFTERNGEFFLNLRDGLLLVDPRHGHIQMQYRYASDWTREQAAEVVALVKAEIAAKPVLTDRWWICDDDALPDRPSVPCKFSVD
jgi:hypothetical protein